MAIDREKVAARLRERAEEVAQRREQLGGGASETNASELADYDQHPADQGTETFEQERDASTDRMLEDEERAIATAKQRLDDGTYGTCVDCGKEIPEPRLEAMPEAIRCIDDQNRFEAQVRARGGPTLDAY